MLSVTDNSRGRAVIPRHIVAFRQIARLKTEYSVFSCQPATGSAEVPLAIRSKSDPAGCLIREHFGSGDRQNGS
jgi:hypothetical protein